MTEAERIELLRQLRAQTSVAPQAEIDQEVAEIDATIEAYEEQIAELEAKIADLDNYLYESPNKETRDLTEELLEESCAEQLETLDREDAEYEELKDLGTRIYDSYSDDIAQLDTDIAAIERRLRKNEIAVSKNLRMQLSVEDLEDLTSELEMKKARKAEFEQYQQLYVTDIKDYSDLLEANNKKRQILLAKQEKLNAVKESRKNNASIINRHQLRLDQDELSRLKAGVVALQTRKEHITFDAYAVLDRLIADAEKGKEEIEVSNEMAAPAEEDITPLTTMPVLEVPQREEEVDADYEAAFTTPSSLDEEREAVVEESSEELIEKKKTSKVKEFLKRNYKKFIAAGLAVLTVLALKQCSSTLDYNEASNEETLSYTQDYEEEEKDDEETTLETEEETKTEDTNDKNDSTNIDNDDDKEKTDNLIPDPEKDTEKNDDNNVNNNITDDNKTNEDTDTGNNSSEDVVEENKVELSAGESVGNISDIVNGEAISHGDEVGTELDSGIELKDYTDEGNAIVDLVTNEVVEDTSLVAEDVQQKAPTEEKTLHQTLEEFFGGPISITDSENAYEMGEETPEKTR